MVASVPEGIGIVLTAVCLIGNVALFVFVIEAIAKNEIGKSLIGGVLAVAISGAAIVGLTKCSSGKGGPGSGESRDNVWENVRRP